MAVKVYIVYYLMYGHVERLAKEILKGVNSVQDVEGTLWQVPETLSTEELARLRAPPKSDVPIITTFKLLEADGFAFGFPRKYLWKTQMLATKPAGIFYSIGYQGGGQETTALTAVTQLVHHGMIYVPIGYTLGPGMKEMKEVKGGSPYGAGTYADDGSREPTELELEQAFHQGNHIATIAKRLKEDNRVY